MVIHLLQAYVVAEVQLWMLRVPLDVVNNANVTPPSVLSDIALALPLLLSPPHFCRTGWHGGMVFECLSFIKNNFCHRQICIHPPCMNIFTLARFE